MFQEFNFSKDLDALDYETNDGHRFFVMLQVWALDPVD